MAYRVIGQPVERAEGADKVSGKAGYSADVLLPGMIWAKALRSPHPHARIKWIDISKARRRRGVLAVITAEDLPPVLTGRMLRDMPILARDKVRFIGERVAVVAAQDRELAEEAANLIVVEYEELPTVFDPREAMREGASIIHEEVDSYNLPHKRLNQPPPPHPNVHSLKRWSLGDVEAGFGRAEHVFEHTFTTQYQHQGYLEPYAGMVQIDKQGRVQVWLSDKTPYAGRKNLADTLQLPEENFLINLTNIGGDFGGKGSIMDMPLCYVLAKKTQRPVKMVMSYTEELTAANPRHPSFITLKTGLTRDGKIVARTVRATYNSGAYGAFKPTPPVNLMGAARGDGVYAIPNLLIYSYSVYTNCMPCGHSRAPGEPQMIFAEESHMDMIAHALRMEPYELRKRNLLHDGFTLADGHLLKQVKVSQTLDAAIRASDYKKGKRAPNVGRGMALCHRTVGTGESETLLSLNEDGSFTLLTSIPDTGTGSHTILRQIAAEVLSVPVEKIQTQLGNTDTFKNDTGPGGSRVTHVSGQAVYQAAELMKKKIFEGGERLFELPKKRLAFENGWLRPKARGGSHKISLKRLAAEFKKLGGLPQVTGQYKASQKAPVTCFCAQVAEVEVDEETGQIRVRSIVNAQDSGRVLNPIGFQGQIDGGVITGVGFALTEEIRVEEGKVVTANLGEYKMPTIKDIPRLTTAVLEEPEGPAPFQAKSIGESTTSPVAGAIANAVYDAVGVRITDLPITSEKVYAAMQFRNRARF